MKGIGGLYILRIFGVGFLEFLFIVSLLIVFCNLLRIFCVVDEGSDVDVDVEEIVDEMVGGVVKGK